MATRDTVSLEQAAKKIKESNTIALVLPDSPAVELFGAAAAFTSGLKRLEKIVSVFKPSLPAQAGLIPWGETNENTEPLRDFIISFDLTRSPVRELKYERDSNRLNIVLSPTGSSIRREDVEFRAGKLSYDLVITLGALSLESAAAGIANVPELLYEKPILNIDANPANTRYGEMNLVPDRAGREPSPTLPELVYKLLGALGAEVTTPDDATLLLASLAAATKNFHPVLTGANAFAFAGELIKRGGSLEDAHRHRALGRAPALQQLAARAFVRSRLDVELNIVWAILTKEDFMRTSSDRSAIPAVAEHLIELFPAAGTIALMYQDKNSPEVESFVRTLNATNALPVPRGTYQSFEAAEGHIAQLLRGADAIQ